MKEKNSENIKYIRASVKDVKHLIPRFVLIAVLCCIIIAAGIIGPIVLGDAIEALYDFETGKIDSASDLLNILIPKLVLLGVIYLVYGFVSFFKNKYRTITISGHYTNVMRIKMADKIKRLPIKYIDNAKVGNVIDNVTDDISTLGNALGMVFETGIMGFVQMITLVVMMFIEDYRLALLVIALLPVSIIITVKISEKSEKHWTDFFKGIGDVCSVIEESFSNIHNTRAYNYEEITEKKQSRLNNVCKIEREKALFYNAILPPMVKFVNAISYILICVVGGLLIVYGGVRIGVIVTILIYSGKFQEPLDLISEGIGSYRQFTAASKRVYDFLNETEEVEPETRFVENATGNIEFQNVYFSYVKERPLIKDLSISVKKGQTVAIVGPTGAGKTTLVNLLMRFYDLDSGRILIDGVDIATVPRDDVRKKFAMVLQETWLFKGTVYENVSYGNPHATKEEIEKACDESYCDHFIRQLPNGYDTIISDESTAVSSGQKQLLTIARAVLSNRDLLILDEATSNVDTRTEILIQKAMDKLMKGKTCFVIAHRLSTIVDADLILVINEGRIVETGKHEELMEKKGFYYEMHQSQYGIREDLNS